MKPNLNKKIIKGLVIIGILILAGYVVYYYNIKDHYLADDMEITINDSVAEIALFCKDLENKLSESKIWNTEVWECVVAYDEGYNTTDIIYNKTRGLCNCTATLENGIKKSIEVRQSK